jgi:hypothetical protein
MELKQKVLGWECSSVVYHMQSPRFNLQHQKYKKQANKQKKQEHFFFALNIGIYLGRITLLV